VFLYKEVLHQDFGWLDDVVRAKKPTKLPVVLTRDEVKQVLQHLSGVSWLMASLLYGAGLRLMECLRLRIKDVDFATHQMTVREGKGAYDRVTMLPDSVHDRLAQHACPLREVVISPCGVRGFPGLLVPERGHGSSATPVLRESMAKCSCSPGTKGVCSLPHGSNGTLSLQRHFSALTKFAHVESRFCGRQRRGNAAFDVSINPCVRSACSRSVAVGLLGEISRL